MPRPTRVQMEGALCYISSRAMAGERLFRDDRDYAAYLELLQEYRTRFGFRLFAYVLLPEELHLCLEPAAGTTVSEIMHALNSRYTKYVAKRHGRAGHIFQSRFKSTLLEKAPSLLRVTGYLHTHPRRCGAGDDLLRYRWSSLADYLAADPERAETIEVLQQLARLRPDWTYALYLQSVPETEWQAVGRELERSVVGSEAFLTAVEAKRLTATRRAAPRAAEPHPLPRRTMSPALTLSAAVAVTALVASLLAARNIAFLKQTVHVLAQENQQILTSFGAAVRSLSSGVRLASWSAPRRLAGTSWDIHLKPALAAPSEASLTDRIQFEGSRMVSAELQESGFTAGRYTSAPQQAGGLVWESVQAGPGGEIVTWQGEQRGSSVHGVMTRQRPGEPVATFRFIGVETTET